MKIKILMMLKDEDELARPWVHYHGALVGFENLIVYDNGTVSPPTLRALDWARKAGVEVSRDYHTAADFIRKGEILGDGIKALAGSADFFFPLDCDEFLAVGAPDDVRCDKTAIDQELANYLGCPQPLRIGFGLDSHPRLPGQFRLSLEQRKTFFASGMCKTLDHGFHEGQTCQGLEALRTRIVYVHFHYKPYEVLQKHARAKLVPYTADFSRDGLNAYIDRQGPGFHCAMHLLKTEEEYRIEFDQFHYQTYGKIVEAFTTVVGGLPFGLQ